MNLILLTIAVIAVMDAVIFFLFFRAARERRLRWTNGRVFIPLILCVLSLLISVFCVWIS